MHIVTSSNARAAGRAAAAFGANRIRQALEAKGHANIIVATGASQFEMIETLIEEPDIAWERVTAFHLDEYVGLPITHGASFRAYLWNRLHRKLPRPLQAFHYIAGDQDPGEECRRLGALIQQHPIDVCFAGIGENGHLAFNDPPADFTTTEPFLVVSLDEACRRQQFGEGWFESLAAVPQRAISMSISQIMKSRCVIIVAPDQRKARAVQGALTGPITPEMPSSILQRHTDTHVFLDSGSASLLRSS